MSDGKKRFSGPTAIAEQIEDLYVEVASLNERLVYALKILTALAKAQGIALPPARTKNTAKRPDAAARRKSDAPPNPHPGPESRRRSLTPAQDTAEPLRHRRGARSGRSGKPSR